jgi:hypothetical protein
MSFFHSRIPSRIHITFSPLVSLGSPWLWQFNFPYVWWPWQFRAVLFMYSLWCHSTEIYLIISQDWTGAMTFLFKYLIPTLIPNWTEVIEVSQFILPEIGKWFSARYPIEKPLWDINFFRIWSLLRNGSTPTCAGYTVYQTVKLDSFI